MEQARAHQPKPLQVQALVRVRDGELLQRRRRERGGTARGAVARGAVARGAVARGAVLEIGEIGAGDEAELGCQRRVQPPRQPLWHTW
mgnify:CR=1 FL=1